MEAFEKSIPESSKVYSCVIISVARKKSRQKTNIRLVEKIRNSPIYRTRINKTFVGRGYNPRKNKNRKKNIKYFSCHFKAKAALP